MIMTFWEWMEEKGYGGIDIAENYYIEIADNGNKSRLNLISKKYWDIPKQMLLGYLTQYLVEEERIFMGLGFVSGRNKDGWDSIEEYHDKMVVHLKEKKLWQ